MPEKIMRLTMIGNDVITHLKFKRILYDDKSENHHYEVILSCGSKYDPIQCLMDYLHDKGVYYQTHRYKISFECTETVNLWSVLKFILDSDFGVIRLSNILYKKLLYALLTMASHSFDLCNVNNDTLITKYIALYENKEVNQEVKNVVTLKTNSTFENVTASINIVKSTDDGKEPDVKSNEASTPPDVNSAGVKTFNGKPADVKSADVKSSNVKPADVKLPNSKHTDVKPDMETRKLDCSWYTEDNPKYNPYARSIQRTWDNNPNVNDDDDCYDDEPDNFIPAFYNPEKVITKADLIEAKSSDKGARIYSFKPNDGDIIKIPHYEVNVISDGKCHGASISGYDASKQADVDTSAKIYCHTSPLQKQ